MKRDHVFVADEGHRLAAGGQVRTEPGCTARGHGHPADALRGPGPEAELHLDVPGLCLVMSHASPCARLRSAPAFVARPRGFQRGTMAQPSSRHNAPKLRRHDLPPMPRPIEPDLNRPSRGKFRRTVPRPPRRVAGPSRVRQRQHEPISPVRPSDMTAKQKASFHVVNPLP